MSSVNSVTWTWPADVLAFAREQGIEQYLDLVRDMAREAFPGLRDVRVEVGRAPDHPFGEYLKWEITTSKLDREAYIAQTEAWYRKLREIVPPAKSLLFSKRVVSVPG